MCGPNMESNLQYTVIHMNIIAMRINMKHNCIQKHRKTVSTMFEQIAMKESKSISNKIKIRRPFGSRRVEPSSNLQIFKCLSLHFFLSSFLVFLSSELPTPRRVVYLSPFPPPGHQLENLFRGRTSSVHNFCQCQCSHRFLMTSF